MRFALLAVALLLALPAPAEEPAPGLPYSKTAWARAWGARKRLKESGAALGAPGAELLRDADEILKWKKGLANGTLGVVKRLKACEGDMAALEKQEAEVLAKIRAYGGAADHPRDELKELQAAQAEVSRRLRECRADLDGLKDAASAELVAFRERCNAFARRTEDAFVGKGLIRRSDFDKVAKDLMRREDYGIDADGKTHCAGFASDFARAAFRYSGLRAKTSNEIVDMLKTGKDGWVPVWDGTEAATLQEGLKKAQEEANRGYLVLALYRSPDMPDAKGHVAVVLPGELKRSELWGLDVPDTAQAGRIVFERGPLSVGFEKNRDIVIFVRKP